MARPSHLRAPRRAPRRGLTATARNSARAASGPSESASASRLAVPSRSREGLMSRATRVMSGNPTNPVSRSRTTDAAEILRWPLVDESRVARSTSPPTDVGRKLDTKSPATVCANRAGSGVGRSRAWSICCQRTVERRMATRFSATAAATKDRACRWRSGNRSAERSRGTRTASMTTVRTTLTVSQTRPLTFLGLVLGISLIVGEP